MGQKSGEKTSWGWYRPGTASLDCQNWGTKLEQSLILDWCSRLARPNGIASNYGSTTSYEKSSWIVAVPMRFPTKIRHITEIRKLAQKMLQCLCVLSKRHDLSKSAAPYRQDYKTSDSGTTLAPECSLYIPPVVVWDFGSINSIIAYGWNFEKSALHSGDVVLYRLHVSLPNKNNKQSSWWYFNPFEKIWVKIGETSSPNFRRWKWKKCLSETTTKKRW